MSAAMPVPSATQAPLQKAKKPAANVVFARVLNTALRDVLNEAGKATGKRRALPILSCVLLDMDKDAQTIRVRTTNLERGYDTTINAEVSESCRVAVDFARLRALLATLTTPEMLTLATNADRPNSIRVIASLNATNAWVSGMDAQEFPLARPVRRRCADVGSVHRGPPSRAATDDLRRSGR
jgi:hypothetical protein